MSPPPIKLGPFRTCHVAAVTSRELGSSLRRPLTVLQVVTTRREGGVETHVLRPIVSRASAVDASSKAPRTTDLFSAVARFMSPRLSRGSLDRSRLAGAAARHGG